MTRMKRSTLFIYLLLLSWIVLAPADGKSIDPLESWRDTSNKHAIIAFVKSVSTPGNAEFVPEEFRIATFDMDGTLLVEKPVSLNEDFNETYLENMVKNAPSLGKIQPYKAILEKDSSYQLANKYQLLKTAYMGVSQAEYMKSALDFVQRRRHPRFDIPYYNLFYAPMLDLIAFLRDNGFRVFVVSGSPQGFVRSIVKSKTGMANSNIMGTQAQLMYQKDKNKPVFMRNGEYRDLGVAGTGKPLIIEYQIGETPILAAGNSAGDQQMFELTATNAYKSLVLCVEHDDTLREYAYESGVTYQANWLKISMKDDFAVVFK